METLYSFAVAVITTISFLIVWFEDTVCNFVDKYFTWIENTIRKLKGKKNGHQT